MRIMVIIFEALLALTATIALVSALIADFCFAGLLYIPIVLTMWFLVWGTWDWLFG